MVKKSPSSIFIPVILFSSAAALFAGEAEEKVVWTAANGDISGMPDQIINVKLSARIPEGWHMYSFKAGKSALPLQIRPRPESLFSLAGPITSEPSATPVNGNEPKGSMEVYVNEVHFNVPLVIKRSAKAGTYEAALAIRSQICSEHFCMLPEEQIIPLKATINASCEFMQEAPSTAQPAAPLPKAFDPQEGLSRAQSTGLIPYLWLAMLAGFFALLTPCVFPMVPITVSFFMKRPHISRTHAIRDAGIYALGIILSFTGLGFLLALLWGASGVRAFASNPWMNLFVAAVFVLLALNLLGLYQFRLPDRLVNKLDKSSRAGQGLGAVLLMGLVFSLTSFTCTVPFVGAILFAATQGEWRWPLMGMLAFSTVFAAPFFLLALFPTALKSLPKAGSWMNSIKILMGFLEIAAALKFISNADRVEHWGLLPRPVFLLAWVALAIPIFFSLLGRPRLRSQGPPPRLTLLRMTAAAAVLAIVAFLSGGLFGEPLGFLDAYVPPPVDQSWLEDWNAGLERAKYEHRPMFVDFSGHTCTNCQYMETNMFKRPEIAALLKKFVRVRLWTDDQVDVELSKHNQELQQQRYKTPALPFYALVSPEGNDLAVFGEGYTEDVRQFEEFLRKGETYR
jgi:thiol:disulfide interchange protein DsbD